MKIVATLLLSMIILLSYSQVSSDKNVNTDSTKSIALSEMAQGNNFDANTVFVLDGKVLKNTDHINPANLASIDILKDASATAIYGRTTTCVIIMKSKGEKFPMATDPLEIKNAPAPDTIKMRGVTHIINPSDRLAQPLYFLDGKSITDPNVVNPETIASIEVLKGSTAVDLYGEPGKNGVVLIRSKHVESDTPNIRSREKKN